MMMSDMALIAAALLAGLSIGLGMLALTRRLGQASAGTSDALRTSLQRQRMILQEQSQTADERTKLAELSRAVGRLVPESGLRRDLLRRYQDAGWPGRWDDERLLGFAILLGIPGAVLLALLLALVRPILFPLGVIGLPLGLGLVSSFLGSATQTRRQAVSQSMPFIMDMMVMSLQAGASKQQTMERVAHDYAGQPVGDEFAAVLADVRSGMSFQDAIANFRLRIPVREVETFADDVIESERMGRPVAETLEHSSSRFKTLRIQNAREAAGKAKVMILIPGVLILFAGLLILFAPFAMKFLQGGYSR